MNSVVSEQGQVTIPKALRERLGIKPGQVLQFSEEDGHIVAVRVRTQDPVDRVYGVLSLTRYRRAHRRAAGAAAEEAMDTLGVDYSAMQRGAALAAAKAWKTYRQQGGSRHGWWRTF